jgi:hypothetical protein
MERSVPGLAALQPRTGGASSWPRAVPSSSGAEDCLGSHGLAPRGGPRGGLDSDAFHFTNPRQETCPGDPGGHRRRGISPADVQLRQRPRDIHAERGCRGSRLPPGGLRPSSEKDGRVLQQSQIATPWGGGGHRGGSHHRGHAARGILPTINHIPIRPWRTWSRPNETRKQAVEIALSNAFGSAAPTACILSGGMKRERRRGGPGATVGDNDENDRSRNSLT